MVADPAEDQVKVAVPPEVMTDQGSDMRTPQDLAKALLVLLVVALGILSAAAVSYAVVTMS